MGQHSTRAIGVLDISGHSEAFSTSLLEETILKLEGVRSARINNIQQKITVEFDPAVTSFDKIRERVRRVM